MGELDFENIFDDPAEFAESLNKEEEKPSEENIETEENKQPGTEEEKTPEGVSTEEENGEEKENSAHEEKSDELSPQQNLYSSFARDLKEKGVLPDLDINYDEIKDTDSLMALIQKQVDSGLNEVQKRVNDALNAGVKSDEIQSYENLIKSYENIDENSLNDETEKGKNLRMNIIYRDMRLKGFSDERARREVEKSFKAGLDIDDAKDSLKNLIEGTKKEYNDYIESKKKEQDDERKSQEKFMSDVQNEIMNGKILGDLDIDKKTREKIYNNYAAQTERDENGYKLTKIQEYQKTHPVEFVKNMSILFTLTDGFKNLDRLVKNKVEKGIKKERSSFEDALRKTNVSSDGTLNFVTNANDGSSNDIKKWDFNF